VLHERGGLEDAGGAALLRAADPGRDGGRQGASVIGAIQCQEALKLLHGKETLDGEGYFFDGWRHDSYRITYQRNGDCLSHDPAPEIRELDRSVNDTTAGDLLRTAREALGKGAKLEFARELLRGLECARCGKTEEVFRPLTAVSESDAACPKCGEQRAPLLYHSCAGTEAFLDRPLAELGIPPWDTVFGIAGEKEIGWELAGDRPAVLGSLDASPS
jgi:adenylyltransferase/sulfurtransferase